MSPSPLSDPPVVSGPPVGRVLGTADATPLSFWVAVEPGAYLQLDDVVVTRRELPDREPVTISGVVTAVRARHEGALFESDVFAIADGTLPAQVQEAAEITTTRVEPELYVPPTPGAVVHRAAGEVRSRALYFDRMEQPVPLGAGRDGAPVYLNFEFLNGQRGAHVSISGISGVATKTSFATFLLYSVFRSGVLGAEAVNTKALIFNVKGEESRPYWVGSAVGLGTVNAFARRLIASKKDLGRLIRGDLPAGRPHAVNTAESAQMTVVDLHNLPDRAQRFVVGVTLKTEFERKEKAGTAKPLLFVVLDELNKYAPREGSSPIKEILLDIAERGRSLGVVLIGAQQTASEVERRIVANSAIRVVGRLDPAEAGRPEYGFLPPAQRARALIAKPGTMFVNQPELPVPLVVEFPFPAWATRPAEAGPAPRATLRSLTQAADAFAVVGARPAGASLSDDDIPF